MKSRDLTEAQMAAVECPTCGAAIGEVCELNSGGPRSEPHHDRILAAEEAANSQSEPRARNQQCPTLEIPNSSRPAEIAPTHLMGDLPVIHYELYRIDECNRITFPVVRLGADRT